MSSAHRPGGWRVGFATLLAVVASACGAGARHRATPTTLPATTTTVPPTTTTVAVTRYQVKQGDTLSAIAARFKVPSATIVSVNHLANPDQLVAGQVLSIPNPPSASTSPGQGATLSVSPTVGPPGQIFGLTLSGAKAGETITFQITGPGVSFKGPPHTAPATGQVSAGYATSGGDQAGPYQVTATGSQGTSVHGSFQVNPATTTTSSQ